MKKDIIRVGDKVRVVTPRVFVRCGYPKTIPEEAKIVAQEFRQEIDALLVKTEVMSSGCSTIHLHAHQSIWPQRAFDKICAEIAHARLRRNGFGGRNREIYDEEDPSLEGEVFVVHQVRFVKTGIYNSGRFSHCDYYEDYEPPYLSNQETHKILGLDAPNGLSCLGNPYLEMEAIHVVKINEE
jgi:hypothetical protein